MEYRKRFLVKALSYRFLGSGFAFLIAWLVSRNVTFSISVMSVDAFGKICLYYFHECVWDRVEWGRSGDQSATAAVDTVDVPEGVCG